MNSSKSMSNSASEKNDNPRQTTEKGYEIPVPRKGDVMRDLLKVARPKKDSDKESDES